MRLKIIRIHSAYTQEILKKYVMVGSADLQMDGKVADALVEHGVSVENKPAPTMTKRLRLKLADVLGYNKSEVARVAGVQRQALNRGHGTKKTDEAAAALIVDTKHDLRKVVQMWELYGVLGDWLHGVKVKEAVVELPTWVAPKVGGFKLHCTACGKDWGSKDKDAACLGCGSIQIVATPVGGAQWN